MILNEIFDNKFNAHENPANDQSVPKLSDVRKVKLTLAQINKLRQLSDVRRFEQEKRLTQIRLQYGAVPTGGM